MDRIVYLDAHSFWVEYDSTRNAPTLKHVECLSDETMVYRNGWLTTFKMGQKLSAADLELYTVDRAQKISLKKALQQELILDAAAV